jgi:phosphate transport system substrate-binding protein
MILFLLLYRINKLLMHSFKEHPEDVSVFTESRKIIMPLFFLLLIGVQIIFSPPVSAAETLKIGGTGTSLGSMNLLAAAFEKAYPDIKVMVLPSLGSSGGISAVAKGALDIGVSARAFTSEELSLGLQAIEFARTPLVPVTSAGMSFPGLSSGEIIKIFRGEMLVWPDGTRIRPVLRPADESVTLTLRKMSPEMSDAVDVALKRQGMLMALTDQEAAEMIENIPGSFGFSTLAQIISEKRCVKVLAYNGVLPDIHSLSDRSYLFFKVLYFVIQKEPSEPVRQFIDFARSDEGRKILEESGNLVAPGKHEN